MFCKYCILFQPEPKIHHMKKDIPVLTKMNPPRLFDEVIEVLARNKDLKGLSYQNIVQEVELDLKKGKKPMKNIFEMGKLALSLGTHSGLINKQYYQLVLSKAEYNIYKTFRERSCSLQKYPIINCHLSSLKNIKTLILIKKR